MCLHLSTNTLLGGVFVHKCVCVLVFIGVGQSLRQSFVWLSLWLEVPRKSFHITCIVGWILLFIVVVYLTVQQLFLSLSICVHEQGWITYMCYCICLNFISLHVVVKLFLICLLINADWQIAYLFVYHPIEYTQFTCTFTNVCLFVCLSACT